MRFDTKLYLFFGARDCGELFLSGNDTRITTFGRDFDDLGLKNMRFGSILRHLPF